MLRIAFLILIINQTFAWDIDPMRVSKANKAKEQASVAFVMKNYDLAISKYKYLLDTLKISDQKAQLNLAHCYMRKADYTNALNYYTTATKLQDRQLRSIAFQQLGILASEKENKEEAIANFKNALINNPANKQARFNYELMVKNKKKETPKSDDKKDRDKEEKKNKEQEKKEEEKKKEEQKKEDQKKKEEQDKKDQEKKENKDDKKEGDKDDQNKDGKKDDKSGKDDLKQKEKEDDKGKPDEKNKDGKPDDKKEDDKKPGEKKDGKGDKGKENKPDENGQKKDNVEKPSEKGEQKKNTQTEANKPNKEQLQKMNMTEQQAKAILNAMRQGEAQYIQEMKRVSTKPNSGGNKKDW